MQWLGFGMEGIQIHRIPFFKAQPLHGWGLMQIALNLRAGMTMDAKTRQGCTRCKITAAINARR